MNIECTIENNILHIKSDIFRNPGTAQILEYNFQDFLNSFFEAYHLENIEQLVHDWYRLKDEFGKRLDVFLNVGMFLMS